MIRKIALLILVFGLMSFIEHKFYVSITQIKYQSETQHFEISLKVFTDDLEKALQVNDTTLRIDNQESIDQYASQIQRYLKQHFYFTPNIPLTYIGAEIDYDVVWVYLESSPINQTKEYQLNNSIFMNIYPEQVNIVNLQLGSETQSLLFQPSNTKQPLKL